MSGLRRWSWLALLAPAACGGGQWREVDARLNDAAAPVRAQGFAPLSGPFNDFGAFTDSLRYGWEVALDSGQTYVIGAACTAECTALDAAVAAPSGERVAADSAAGPEPFVRLTAAARGTYTVALAGRCRPAARCRWASQVYARGVSELRPGFAGGKR